MKTQDMNLLAKYEEVTKTKASQYSDNKLYVVILVVVFLLFGAFSIKLFVDNMLLNSEVESVEEFVSNPRVQSKLAYVNSLESDIAQIEEMLFEVESINEVFGAGVRFNSVPIRVLNYSRPEFVEFQNLTYQSGSIAVVISGRSAFDISNYVLRLERTNHFKKVSYSGYTYDEGQQLYFSTIQCVLKGGN